jgi:hypothetical protein
MNKRPAKVTFSQTDVFDSVHEKDVRHDHLSTLHIWPADASAACRAALISSLPDPESRRAPEILRRLAGDIVGRW